MDYVTLGGTGLKVSRLCLGCMTYGSPNWRPWILGEEAAQPFFRQALDAGINFFDTADAYSFGASEEVTGRALKEMARREEVVIATKVFFPTGEAKPNAMGLSRKHIMAAVDASLTRLGIDYIDLYQIHRLDPETPMEETLEALHDVVRAGKARYIGASSMFAWQFMKMLATSSANGWTRFVSMQPQYNLVYREEEREMLPLCRDQGVGVIPWSPLARGFLAGGRPKPNEGETERARTDDFSGRLYFQEADFAVVDAVSQVAKARGLSNMQVALAWVLKNPAITAPIIGASKPQHLSEAIAAVSVVLTDDDIKTLEAPYRPKSINDHS